LRPVVLVMSNLLYTIPSLALFVVIPGIIGSKILDSVNVVLALTIYTAALLVRPVLDALDAVPSHVISAATAIGYRPVRRFLGVELPLAVPVLTAGVRVASVSNISLVSVGALIGTGGLGLHRRVPAGVLLADRRRHRAHPRAGAGGRPPARADP
jgi:osmoprotectant transport system permease protein